MQSALPAVLPLISALPDGPSGCTIPAKPCASASSSAPAMDGLVRGVLGRGGGQQDEEPLGRARGEARTRRRCWATITCRHPPPPTGACRLPPAHAPPPRCR